jgi:hypothetical protein
MRSIKARRFLLGTLRLLALLLEAFDTRFPKIGRLLLKTLALLSELFDGVFRTTLAKVGVLVVSLLVILRFCAHAQLAPYPAPAPGQAVAPPQLLPPPPGYPAPPVATIPSAPQPPVPQYVQPAGPPLPPGPQYPAPPPPPGPPLEARTPPQGWAPNPTITGRVRRYLLTPVGEVEGVELDDGTDVRFPPHVGDRVVTIVKPGDSIAVSGEPGPSTAYGRVIKAFTITNVASQQTVVDEPPRSPRLPPWARRMWTREMNANGTLERYVLNPHGDIDGFFLNNGVEVKFPPHLGAEILSVAAQRQPSWVQVSGDGTANAYGTVVDAMTGTLAVNGIPIPLGGPPAPPGGRGPLP